MTSTMFQSMICVSHKYTSSISASIIGAHPAALKSDRHPTYRVTPALHPIRPTWSTRQLVLFAIDDLELLVSFTFLTQLMSLCCRLGDERWLRTMISGTTRSTDTARLTDAYL